MALSRNQRIVVGIIAVIAIAAALAVIFSAATAMREQRADGYERQTDTARPNRTSTISKKRVVLVKDSAIKLNRTIVTYRGLEGGDIRLDVVILDLDPNYAYPKQISKAAAREGFRLGDRAYRMVSARRNTLELRPAPSRN